MILLILILICFAVYFIYGIATDKESERQRKQNPLNKASLEKYTIKKNLFALFKNYLYENIIVFKRINDKIIIRNKIENDFPNYGDGIDGEGIIFDLSIYNLFQIDYNGKVKLGKTFQILSIAYENFGTFADEIYNSKYKMSYSQGGYYSDFGDTITSKVFYVDLGNAKMYIGLSSGNFEMSKYEKRHNCKSEQDEMYLFSEIEININNRIQYPYFDLINLRKDMLVKEYHSYFTKNIELCKNLMYQNI